MGRPRKNESDKKETEVKEIKKITKEVKDGVTYVTDESFGNDDGFMISSITKVSKEVTEYAATMNRLQGRYLVDQFYQHQQHRINAASQLRAVAQGYDNTSEEMPENLAIQYIYTNARITEKNIEKLLKSWVESQAVGRWLLDIKGIGPVLAACLLANLDISKCNYAGHFWSYVGLNDNKAPWLGKAGADEIDKKAITKWGKDYDKTVASEDLIANIAEWTNRSRSSVEKQIKDEKGKITRASIKAGLAKPPYNTALKTCMFKIGDSFIKVSNKDSLYGKIFKERKAWEHVQNEKGLYAEEAAKQLAKKNFGKDTEAYKSYIEGKLPDGHIMARSRRYAVKLFISHLFEAMYYDYHGYACPKPYVFAHLDHFDYIEPEVPFSKIDEYKKLLKK